MKQLKSKEWDAFQQYLYNKAHGYIWTPDTLDIICSSNDNDPERIGKQILEVRMRMQNEHVAHMRNDRRKMYSVFKVLRGIYPSLLNRTFSRKKRNTFLKKTEKFFEALLRSSSNRKMGKKIRPTVPKDDEPIKKNGPTSV